MATPGPSSLLPPLAPAAVPTSETFIDFHTSLQTAALKATRASAGLPTDLAFYKTVDEGLRESVDVLEGRVLELIGRCVALANGKKTVKGKGREVDGEDVVDDFHGTVVDCVDVLLEKTDICLDEYSGKLKRPVALATTGASTSTSAKKRAAVAVSQKETSYQAKPYLPASLQHASNIAKPQLEFPTKVDNSDHLAPPHLRLLKHKFNARMPLGYVLQKDDVANEFSGGLEGEDSILPSHPYYFEITHLEHPSHVFDVPSTPTEPLPFPSPVTYISTSSQFSTLLAHLTSPSVLEIAVDLEHHSFRTYRGFLCLMQITTRQGGDFIVDLLVPEVRGRMQELNEVFTDPKKVKVFHGAESDVVWLQQDFGIYVVGLFDTFHASKLLDLPRHSLSTLLQLYADYTPDKKYQLADWRIRPLPQEMLLYAQSDTHWLIYLYDRLRGALVDKEASRPDSRINATNNSSNPSSRQNSRSGSPTSKSSNSSRTLLKETLFRSSQTTLRQFTPEVYDAQRGTGPGGWDSLAKKWNKGSLVYVSGDNDDDTNAGGVYKMQRNVYRAVHGWRDKAAREEDESTRYVLPNHFLFTLAEGPPADMGALLGMFRGGAGVPPVVKRRAGALLEVVRGAVRKGLEGGTAKVGEKVVVAPVVESMVVDEEVREGGETKMNEGVAEGSGIWGTTGSSSNSLIAASSSLLGKRPATRLPPVLAATLSTTKSTLFGSVLVPKPSSSPWVPTGGRKPLDSPTFKALVSKINSSLVIAPSVPKSLSFAASSSTSQASETGPQTTRDKPDATEGGEDETTFDPALGMQIDSHPLAYIPASKRVATATTMEDMGPIVVVGRKGNGASANRKKRKRDLASEESLKGAAAASASVAVYDEGEQEARDLEPERSGSGSGDAVQAEDAVGSDVPFNFASASNVLDQGPAKKKAKAGGKKGSNKKGGAKDGQQAKGAGYFYGDFGAPPKSRSDFKGGNKSSTFK